MEVDIVCTGFGPAAGGFLTTLSRGLPLPDGSMPQILCYERADDIGFGVSGVVTKARGIRTSFPDFDPSQIPMAAPVGDEQIWYLLDPVGASQRPGYQRLADQMLRAFDWCSKDALKLPFTPAFLHKKGGFVLSLGQLNQWVGQQLMMTGAVQIWPAAPVTEPIFDNGGVCGVRVADCDVHAALTVVSDGPVGAVGRAIDARFGVPQGHERRDWAVGMKLVIDLPESIELTAGTVIHTFGYPEPEIFGFLYVHPDRIASAGIFIPSWMRFPTATSYRYLQHFLLHPFIWQHVKGGRMRSWGAKTLQESGRRGEPVLAGDGWARIGEGSGTTNVLTGSGVDEAWMSGVLLGEAVLGLMRERKPFTRDNLERTYVAARRASWLDRESRIAENSREGFQRNLLTGMAGMALAAYSKGRLSIPRLFTRKTSRYEAEKPWPEIPYDGQLLVTQQDALLMGGKVQAPPGQADHVRFIDRAVCAKCGAQRCVEMCSGQALTRGPVFDREKCVHCGACMWNCEHENLVFQAGAGGLHSAEN